MPFLPNNQFGKSLSQSQMQANVDVLYPEMKRRGWSDNAIAAMLGNWESECTINPNRPQYKSSFPTGGKGGFGFAQWTPYSNKILWYCRNVLVPPVEGDKTDTNPASDYVLQLNYHDWECQNGLKGEGKKTWYSNHGYSYTWNDFLHSTDDVAELAEAYYWEYERSAAGSAGSRPANAEKWYTYITGLDPNPPTPPDPPIPPDPPFVPTNQNKMSFILKAYCVGTLNAFRIVRYSIEGID